MTGWRELVAAVLAALPRRRLGGCPQSSHGGRRRPSEALPRLAGAAVAGAALVVLTLAEALLPPAVVLVLTVLELLLGEEVVLQLQWGFHVSAAVFFFFFFFLSFFKAAVRYHTAPVEGRYGTTAGQSRGMNRAISAPVESERSLRLGSGDHNNWLDVMKRLQPSRNVTPKLTPPTP